MPPPTAVPPPTTPPPNVKLIGLMMISGRPQGVYSILDSGPGKQPTSYILSADQRQASLEVLSINMTAETSRVKIGEQISDLKLEEPKANTSPGPAAAAGMAAGGPQRPFPGARAGGRGVGGRPGFPVPMPTPGGGGYPGGGYNAAPVGGGYNPAASSSYSPSTTPDNGTLPARPVRTDTTDSSGPPLSPEQQIVAIEQAREQARVNNDPTLPIFPPTPLTPALQSQLGAGGTGGTGEAPPAAPPSLPLGTRTSGSFNNR